ncbi:FAD binding domain-containing protein [Venturia nashicola]|uniref:FAD binding domain-containing protein n=1 Tax=Venturia nashicola TaxID=86259 RepID=A0A4Z1NVV6_9PEZI|nr:FAD binding domain-containing protein [Venturia nashicola]
MPSLTADTKGWVSNGAVQAPIPAHTNGIVATRVNGLYALNGSNEAHAVKGKNGTTLVNGKTHQKSFAELDDVPVLIVGGGPTGLLLAYLLSKLNVKSLLIEKYPQRLAAPKAHALNPRTLEICRQFGLDTRKLRQLGTPRGDAYWVNFVTSLSGEQIGVLPYERMDPAVLDDTPEMIHNIPQPDFEQFVADELATDPNVEIRKGVAFVSGAQNKHEVLSKVEERATGRQYVIRSQHVIACDGGRSAVRSMLGIECEGEDSYETMMTIHFSADLRPVVGERVGMLHWILDPATSGFLIGYDLAGNQVIISNFDPKKHPVESWTTEHAREVVAAAIGKDVPFDLLSFRPWVLSRKVANQYSQGRIILAGDAAHSFPPTGGLGLNTGLADVHNIAYKIAAVHQGWGGESLLETYGEERRHLAHVNSTQSVKNGKKIFSFLKALGTAGLDELDEARQRLTEAIHDPSKKELIENHVEAQREHFDNLELHIGYVYGDKSVPPNASTYTPKFVPGARLPHAWIRVRHSNFLAEHAPLDISYVSELSSEFVAARQYSVLDLCAIDSFTMLVGSQSAWMHKFKELRKALSRRGVKLNMFAADEDFDFTTELHRDLFADGVELRSGGGLLLRPDQHILTRLSSGTTVGQMESDLLGHLQL